MEKHHVSQSTAGLMASIVGGLFSAVPSHPFDVVKTCMQQDLKQEKYTTFTRSVKLLYKEVQTRLFHFFIESLYHINFTKFIYPCRGDYVVCSTAVSGALSISLPRSISPTNVVCTCRICCFSSPSDPWPSLLAAVAVAVVTIVILIAVAAGRGKDFERVCTLANTRLWC